jgi:hypothetical protein
MKNLKISALSIFLLSFTLFANSQDTINDLFSEKNELSIVIDNVFAKNQDNYPIFYTTSQGSINIIPFDDFSGYRQTTIGLSYKRHFKKSALRSKISFASHSYKENDTETVGFRQDSKSLFTSFDLGYEWNVNLTRVRFFYGFDLFINYRKNEIVFDNNNIGIVNDFHRVTTLKSTGYGISPLMGVRIYVTKSISFSTELKFVIGAYNGSDVSETTEGEFNYSSDDSYNGTNFGFGPLGQISVNIHF